MGTLDAHTPFAVMGCYLALVGIGTGMLMQNLVLIVQNEVSVHRDGRRPAPPSRSSGAWAVRSGVSVLGAVLGTRVSTLIARASSPSRFRRPSWPRCPVDCPSRPRSRHSPSRCTASSPTRSPAACRTLFPIAGSALDRRDRGDPAAQGAPAGHRRPPSNCWPRPRTSPACRREEMLDASPADAGRTRRAGPTGGRPAGGGRRRATVMAGSRLTARGIGTTPVPRHQFRRVGTGVDALNVVSHRSSVRPTGARARLDGGGAQRPA